MIKLIKEFNEWLDSSVYIPINNINYITTNNVTILLGILILTFIIVYL